MLSEAPEEQEYTSASPDESDTSFCVLDELQSKQQPQKIVAHDTDRRVDLSQASSESV
jgi:hypothetical protein